MAKRPVYICTVTGQRVEIKVNCVNEEKEGGQFGFSFVDKYPWHDGGGVLYFNDFGTTWEWADG